MYLGCIATECNLQLKVMQLAIKLRGTQNKVKVQQEAVNFMQCKVIGGLLFFFYNFSLKVHDIS